MIKRIIFDLDNTLIKWEDEYRNALKKTVEFYKLDVNYLDIDNLVESYEDYYSIYKKENMLKLFNEKLNLNLEMSFIDMWLYELGFMANYNEEVEETLKYLSSKYELVVLTNWLKDVQERRLETAKIDKYFSEIYGGEKYAKPNIESYKIAMGNCKIDECVMIGDNYKIDIEGAKNMGMKVIQTDYKNKINNKEDYQVIKNFKELKDIL